MEKWLVVVGFAYPLVAAIYLIFSSMALPGRAIWVSLLIDGRSFGFLSVYAPTESHAKSVFWDAISQNLPSMDTWIVGGDSIILSCHQMSELTVSQEYHLLLLVRERIGTVFCWPFVVRMHGTCLLLLIYMIHYHSRWVSADREDAF